MGANLNQSCDTESMCAAALLGSSGPINSTVKYFSPFCTSCTQNHATQVRSALRPRLVISGPAATGWSLVVGQKLQCHGSPAWAEHSSISSNLPVQRLRLGATSFVPSLLQEMGRMKRKDYCFPSTRLLMTAWAPRAGYQGWKHTLALAVSINSQNTVCTHSAPSATHSGKDSQLSAFLSLYIPWCITWMEETRQFLSWKGKEGAYQDTEW